ncbi:hypothetical protein BFP76_04595 [Amylibacter kogurei]|uniref:Uncharacterized protein n=1 Tax=Paramylibacter kogurei TaxID=1889778 RepID=A0A2G5K4M1_9RHOB|nr:hypothetical protein BFP76_04595 [Amylibacter kogurei]
MVQFWHLFFNALSCCDSTVKRAPKENRNRKEDTNKNYGRNSFDQNISFMSLTWNQTFQQKCLPAGR